MTVPINLLQICFIVIRLHTFISLFNNFSIFLFRELDLNATQVVFMNGNETVVTDGVAEYSFLYDHSFWSMDKNQGAKVKIFM